MWAVAEVLWEDPNGLPCRTPATIEDTSVSGACIRVKTPITVGSRVTVKWHREQFSAIARNCRTDGWEFLLGVRREANSAAPQVLSSASPKVIAQCAPDLASLSWEDPYGVLRQSTGTIESSSESETMVRIGGLVRAGTTVKIQWQDKHFSGVAQYCRWRNRAYHVRLSHDGDGLRPPADAAAPPNAPKPVGDPQAIPLPEAVGDVTALFSPAFLTMPSPSPSSVPVTVPSAPPVASAVVVRSADAAEAVVTKSTVPPAPSIAAPGEFERHSPLLMVLAPKASSVEAPPSPAQPAVIPGESKGSFARQERKVMSSKTLFPKFWRRQQDGSGAPNPAFEVEAQVKSTNLQSAEGLTGPQGDLLSYEDIYRAAGIVAPVTGYGIHKVVEMLDSPHIRTMAKDVQRASVLMALEAAGSSIDDLLKDATRRHQALSSYEAGQQSKLEDFEARKAQEDAKIQAELELVTAHYAERIRLNHEQVAKEKEALHNWQMAKQQESQRITDVIDLCAKQLTPAAGQPPAPSAAQAAAGKP
jgi:hypothetical protein